MMNSKYALVVAGLIFAAGLVSGMFAQRMLAPEPAPEQSAAPAATPPGETLGQMEQRRPRTERPPRDETFDWMEPAPAPAVAPEPREESASPDRAMRDERDGGTPPWGRVAWTSREAWIEQRRLEQQARMQSIRSNLVEKAKLDEQQAVRFDVLVTAMNMRLLEQTKLWQQALEDGALTRPEVRARAMKEIGTVLSMTYDELDRNMPPEWRTETTNEAVNLWTFIEPEIWTEMRPLMGRGRPPRPPSP